MYNKIHPNDRTAKQKYIQFTDQNHFFQKNNASTRKRFSKIQMNNSNITNQSNEI